MTSLGMHCFENRVHICTGIDLESDSMSIDNHVSLHRLPCLSDVMKNNHHISRDRFFLLGNCINRTTLAASCRMVPLSTFGTGYPMVGSISLSWYAVFYKTCNPRFVMCATRSSEVCVTLNRNTLCLVIVFALKNSCRTNH